MKLRQIKNWFLILTGHTLANKHRYLVRWNWKLMRQEWTNPYRKVPYSLDDESWYVS